MTVLTDLAPLETLTDGLLQDRFDPWLRSKRIRSHLTTHLQFRRGLNAKAIKIASKYVSAEVVVILVAGRETYSE